MQWRRYDFQGSDHFILLCENTSNPPEVLSCYKRFICYTLPAKLVTASTFHEFFFHDVPSELWLQHQKSVLENLCICLTRHIYVVSLPNSRRESSWYSTGRKKTAGKPEERDQSVEEARMIKTTGKYGIPGLEREPRLLGLCFPVNIWKNSMSVFRWLVDRELLSVVPIMPLTQARVLCQDLMVLAFLTAT